MIELADMGTFIAVVETSSFTEAARRLGTTKSVVSRRVSEMEKELGAPLLDRSSRSVRATEVGAVYYAKCVRILESVGAANDFVTSHHQLVKGRLRLAIQGEPSASLLLPLLNRFAERFPDVLLDVETRDDEIVLSDSHYDVAVRSGRLGDSSLIARPLTDYRRWLCAAPAYLQASSTPQTLDELATHDGLIDATEDGHGFWQLQSKGQMQTVRIRERLRSNDIGHLLEAAMAGLGIVLAPAPLLAPAIERGQLEIVLPGHAPPPQPVSLVYPQSRRNSPKVQSLLAFLAEHFDSPGRTAA